MALKSYTWLVTLRSIVTDRLRREDGEFAMEWAIISGIVLVIAATFYTTGAPGAIEGAIQKGFDAIDGITMPV
jgi:hypothetical protein